MKIALIAAALSLAACTQLGEDGIGETLQNDIPDAGPISVQVGVVRVTVAGQSAPHTGVLLAPDLVYTSARWITSATDPATITVERSPPYSAVVRRGRYVNASSYLSGAVVQLDAPYAGAHIVPIETRTPAQLVGTSVTCFSYRAAGLASVTERFVAGPPVALVDVAGTLVDADASAPCFGAGWVLVGAVEGKTGSNASVQVLSQVKSFLDAMKHLAEARAVVDSGGSGVDGPLRLYTLATDGVTRMCFDIANNDPNDHAQVNQYPCHTGLNQRWYLDSRNSTAPMILSASSGRCIDIPDTATDPGRNVQMSACNAQANQRFDMPLVAPPSTITIHPQSAPNLCLAVEGGPSTQARPIEQAACTGGSALWHWSF